MEMPFYTFCGLSDPISSLSHVIGALVCLIATVPLWRSLENDRLKQTAVGIFCFASIFLLLISGIYHLLPHDSATRGILRKVDHAAIFILIAGTFSPIHAVLFKGFWRWGPLILIWSIAITGIVLKSIFFSQISANLGLAIYLGMGWLGAISCGIVWSRCGLEFVIPLLQGSLSYTFGTIFEFLREPTIIPGALGSHELFHFAVLAGIAFHWKLVKKIAATTYNKAARAV